MSIKKKHYYLFFICIISLFKTYASTNWDGIKSNATYTFNNGDTIGQVTFRTNNLSDSITINVNSHTDSVILSAANNNSYITFDVPDITNTITINISIDTIFKGQGNPPNNKPLLMYIKGSGSVVFNIKQNCILQLGDNNNSIALPVYCLVESNNTISPSLIFQISDDNNNRGSNSILHINNYSCLGFTTNILPTSTNDVVPGSIVFNGSRPTNNADSQNGQLGLKISNGGSIFSEVISPINLPSYGNQFSFQFGKLWQNANKKYGKSKIVFCNHNLGQNTGLMYNLNPFNSYSDAVNVVSKPSTIIIENGNEVDFLFRNDILFENFDTNSLIPRSGFVIGHAGNLIIDNATSVIYFVRSNNSFPLNWITKTTKENYESFRKLKNNGALILEGPFGTIPNGLDEETDMENKPIIFNPDQTPKIELKGTSCFYFGSSVCNNYHVKNYNSMNKGLTKESVLGTALNFTVKDASYWAQQDSIGAISLINHGNAAIVGEDKTKNSIGILTNNIKFTGGRVIPNQIGSIFPVLEFDNNLFGKACFMNDGDIILSNVFVLQSDNLNSCNISKNPPKTSPCWCSGDYQFLLEIYRNNFLKPYQDDSEIGLPVTKEQNYYFRRPKMYLWNTDFGVVSETGFCFEGFDIWLENIPNLYSINSNTTENKSSLIFYKDGKTYEKYMILGSPIDASLQNNFYEDKSCHLDLFITIDNTNTEINNSEFIVKSESADPTFYANQLNIPYDVANEMQFHEQYLKENSGSIFLQETSNITIGSEIIPSRLKLEENMGLKGYFMGQNPISALESLYNICNITSGEGIIGTKKSFITIPILHNNTINGINFSDSSNELTQPYYNISGISQYTDLLDLTNDFSNLILVKKNEFKSVINLDTILLDELTFANPIMCVDLNNKNSLKALNFLPFPTIEGTVDTITLSRNNRLSALKCISGKINSLNLKNNPTNYLDNRKIGIFAQSIDNKNPCHIGVGKHTSSDYIPFEFGPRGIMTYFQGSLIYTINDCMIINGDSQFATVPVCTIKKNEQGIKEYYDLPEKENYLKFKSKSSSINSKMIVKEGSILNFSNCENTDIDFENIDLIFEPNSKMILGNNINLHFLENSTITIIPNFSNQIITIDELDKYSVSFAGEGSLWFFNKSSLNVKNNSFLNIANDEGFTPSYMINYNFLDVSSFNIGENTSYNIFNEKGFGGNVIVGSSRFFLNNIDISCKILFLNNSVFSINSTSNFGINSICLNRFTYPIFGIPFSEYVTFYKTKGLKSFDFIFNGKCINSPIDTITTIENEYPYNDTITKIHKEYPLIVIGYDNDGIYNFEIFNENIPLTSNKNDKLYSKIQNKIPCLFMTKDNSPLILPFDSIYNGFTYDENNLYNTTVLESFPESHYYKKNICVKNGTSRDFYNAINQTKYPLDIVPNNWLFDFQLLL